MLAFLPALIYFILCLYHEIVGTDSHVKNYNITKKQTFKRVFTLLILSSAATHLSKNTLFDNSNEIRIYKIILAMLSIDTVQYWMHRLYHSSRFLYKFHKTHHSLVCPWVIGSLYNSYEEAFITGPVTSIAIYLCNVSYIEYAIVVSLAFCSTIMEHTYKENDDNLKTASFHWIHHRYSKNHNFQQPFFQFWDIAMGTKYKIV